MSGYVVLICGEMRIPCDKAHGKEILRRLEGMVVGNTHYHPVLITQAEERRRKKAELRWERHVAASNKAGKFACFSADPTTCYGCGICVAGQKLAGV